ncbi:hypothetical protein [Desulfovibrio ferrophilus]|uniref:Uncharacterized protein n=1 Tax=Desulfovibrio ferrophilus TaxID=241368 RepID=A0A2Z6AYY4_9BACT|nr:hypothetical protein [Desulfovibrio ferrophilus]BBD08474.1 putative uncharacterized protein [Desulfovibrio ferrophilus]
MYLQQALQKLVMPLALMLLWAAPMTAAETSQCIECHTTPEKLINAVREIARSTVGVPSGSTQFAGEG